MPENALFSYRIDEEQDAPFDPQYPLWRGCEIATIDRYWNGKSALLVKGDGWSNLTYVRSLWNSEFIFFYFEAWFDSLNVNLEWDTKTPVVGLWEKDVVEVFLRPEARHDYFEIEASPLGQWLVAHIRRPREDVDFAWNSRLKLKVMLSEARHIWHVFLALPYETMTRRFPPKAGSAWRLNLFRMAGPGSSREYLAWRPTFTEQPDFHKPGSFGHLIFLESLRCL